MWRLFDETYKKKLNVKKEQIDRRTNYCVAISNLFSEKWMSIPRKLKILLSLVIGVAMMTISKFMVFSGPLVFTPLALPLFEPSWYKGSNVPSKMSR